MNINNINLGYGLTGSFCTFEVSKEILRSIKKEYENINIVPIMSYNSYYLDTKFGKAKDHIEEIESICENKIIHTIQEAEPIGPKNMLDILVICPCTGNTISKLAHDIIDNPITMAVKSHLRNNKPVVLAVSTNNGLSGAAENIGKLLNRKNYYFVPFKQDNPITKPRSLVFDKTYVIKTIIDSLDGKQIQPILL